MPLKPYAIDAIHFFLSGGRFLQEVVIEKNVLSVHWLDLRHNNRGEKQTENPDFTVLKQRTWV